MDEMIDRAWRRRRGQNFAYVEGVRDGNGKELIPLEATAIQEGYCTYLVCFVHVETVRRDGRLTRKQRNETRN